MVVFRLSSRLLHCRRDAFALNLLIFFFFASHVQCFHHHLTKRELHHVFGVDRHDAVPDYALIHASHRRHGDDDRRLHIRFDAWNESYELHLQPNNRLVSPDVISVIRDGNRSTERVGLIDDFCHYIGAVVSHDNASAAISDCGRRLRGTLVMPDTFLVLQPIPMRLRNQHADNVHVIFKRAAGLLSDDIEHRLIDDIRQKQQLRQLQIKDDGIMEEQLIRHADDYNQFCDVNEISAFNYSIPINNIEFDSLFIFPQLDPITLEVGLFLDSQLYRHFQAEYSTQDAEQHLLDFSLALINNVYVLYQQPTLSPNLDLVIVRYELWKSQPVGLETELHRNGQAQTLLDGFCRHQARINPGSDLTDSSHWDHAILLTGYDIYHTTTSVAGVAPVARMCDELFACSLVEGLHLGRSFVLAHEMGHNMGMVHDGVQNQCSRSCCLMSAVNGAGKTTWSTCSVREFNAFLLQLDESGKGNCLRDNGVGLIDRDHRKDGRLPGQRFTGDQQCSYFWGRDYRVEIPVGRSQSDICRILWCGNQGSTISTAHPALEGTWCGDRQWCIEGQCKPWPEISPPTVIDGGWSTWSANELNCPIDNCQVTGSIRLKSQLRTCSNPAPNNGGLQCSGSHIRGLICDEHRTSTCDGLGREQYGDRLCTAFKNEADHQLSGKSFMHVTQPCKVWCHLIGSELIRNKAQFPDGSPCGNNQHCVGGFCLEMNCGGTAVVGSADDCPAGTQSQWAEWNLWMPCSVSCGNGIRERKRFCPVTDTCEGAAKETQTCTNPACIQLGDWSAWTSCSVSCGDGGIETRTRICPPDATCISDTSTANETRSCQPSPPKCISWSEWQAWSSCGTTCGEGKRRRRRDCTIFGQCVGDADQVEVCTMQTCPVREQWGDWLPCSVSCGSGFQSRERLCDGVLCNDGRSSKQARTCNEQPCSPIGSTPSAAPDGVTIDYKWKEWSDWQPCSELCGEGVQRRWRYCISGSCPNEDRIDERRCVNRPCQSTWTQWSAWSSCVHCRNGEQSRRSRSCGNNSVLLITDNGLVSDNANTRRRQRSDDTNSCIGETSQTRICESSECQQLAVANGALLLATVSPLLITASTVSFIDNTSSIDAAWTEWQAWFECSVSCGGGVRKRVRQCKIGRDCSIGSSVQVAMCNEKKCRDEWSDWSSWSSCSRTCGGGQQSRQRVCTASLKFNCVGPSRDDRECESQSCISSTSSQSLILDDTRPSWSRWSGWSQCSCFTLNQFRRRYCEIRDPARQGFCSGPIIEQRPCIPNGCLSENGGWSSWGDWSLCSKDCGTGGSQLRNRMCSNPVPSNRGSYCVGYSFDQRPCPSQPECTGTPINGHWSAWSEWSKCADPCTNSQVSRTRYCSEPRPSNGGQPCYGNDFELQPCAEQCFVTSVDGQWSEWTQWSKCGADCGFAYQSRHRLCDAPAPRGAHGRVCTGLAHMTNVCNTEFCNNSVDGHWSTWSLWSHCTANCGYGQRTRTRECSRPTPAAGGYPCFGRTAELEQCTATSWYCLPTVDNIRTVEAASIRALSLRR